MILQIYLLLLCIAFSYSYLVLSKKQNLISLNIFGKNEADKQEQFRIQQEILNRRKNKSKMNEYFEGVEKRRKVITKEAKSTLWSQSDDKEDPLTKWKEAKASGKIKEIGYEPEPSKSSSIFGVNIIVPLNPIGIPKYDAGERFDLRLPYAERGYEVH